ncbi:hypothetical protein QCA50_009807 [Cerrena zonata]|uniref:DUF6697 domain-containing protein n=1 Tax=Cerrena zonata TaxID=2478898 RepID=A0AAW0G712_9APHY
MLVPCLSKRWKDPTIAFPAEGRAVCPPGNTLFLNQRIFWYFAEDVHGIALAPSALYRPSDQIWTTNDEFTYLLNETKEVFYRGPSHYICYAGTFQCAYTGELPSVDFKRLPAAIKEELIRTSFSRPEMAGVPGERGRLRKLYTDGERKVAFLALQCVGFNQKLYDALLAARPPQLREVEQGSTGSAAKRRRQEETNTGRAAKMMKCGDRSETEASGDELMI